MYSSIKTALRGCRLLALSIFCVYLLSCAVGIFAVQSGNRFALAQRDRIVGTALQSDKAAINYQAGNKLTAACYDFLGNVFLGAVPQTALGLGVVPPYFTVAYQGWVAGIVSVNGSGESRFDTLHSAAYFIVVFLLQAVAYSLSIGAGIKCGLDTYRHNTEVGWKFWRFRTPKESVAAVIRVYLVSLPLFLAGSLFEFLLTWNK